MRSKNKRGGRPPIKYPGYKKERREEHLERAQQLYDEHRSVTKVQRAFEEETGIKIPWSTLHDWLT